MAEASKGTNPHYSASFEAYSSNCQRCVLAYEARRRGHVFIAENVRGKITYVDPQTNKRNNGLNLRNVTRASVTRIDDQRFTDYAKNAFTRQKV